VCRLRLPRRAPRNVAHESTVTRPQSVPSANAISNFPEEDFWPGVISGLSLALIGNASRQTFGAERDVEPRRFR
jgi:hypothetical protein